jgi:hypothetical protein
VAQIDQGRLVGTVTDAQGGCCPASPSRRSPRADRRPHHRDRGRRQVLDCLDSVGPYELTFELSGFQAFKRAGIILGLGQILTVDGQMQVASLQESVTGHRRLAGRRHAVVEGGHRLHDRQAGRRADGDRRLGGSRPGVGVRMNGFDVGGSHKSQQSGYESFGIRNQNRVLNDGVDTTEGTGGAGFYADFFSNEEVAVSAAGGDVEMNSPARRS